MIGASNTTENGTIGTSPQKQDIVTTEKIEQLTANNTQELSNSTLANFTASNPENVTNFTEKVASNQRVIKLETRATPDYKTAVSII
jgi:hypothetical protein